MSFMNKYFFVLAFFPSVSYADFNECKHLFPDANPIKIERTNTRELCFESFAVLSSSVTKSPVFVIEKLSRASVLDAKDEVRTNEFYAEYRLPNAFRATLDDYKGSGYDRGHMAPAADMPNQKSMAESFSLANIIPQDSDNNRNAWAAVEKSTRKYVKRSMGNVYVITGPAYTSSPRFIGDGVMVPSYLWKLVYDESTGRSWAYWMKNQPGYQSLKPISYDQLSQLIGMKLLPGNVR